MVCRDFLHKILTTKSFMDMGVAPIEDVRLDFNRVLAALPPDEARRMKRKFRKMWRRAARTPTSTSAPRYLTQLSTPGSPPTRHQKNLRKAEVYRRVLKTAYLAAVEIETRLAEKK